MNFEEFKRLNLDIVADRGLKLWVVNGFIASFERLGLEKDIKHFYPKGLYTKTNIILYCFYAEKLVIAELGDEDYTFSAINYSQIRKVSLKIGSGSKKKRELVLHFHCLDDIILDSEEDNNTIEEIYKFLS